MFLTLLVAKIVIVVLAVVVCVVQHRLDARLGKVSNRISELYVEGPSQKAINELQDLKVELQKISFQIYVSGAVIVCLFLAFLSTLILGIGE